MQDDDEEASEDAFPGPMLPEGWDKFPNDPISPCSKKYFADQGFGEAKKLIDKLRSFDIKCCVIDVAALNYYGCPFVLEVSRAWVSNESFFSYRSAYSGQRFRLKCPHLSHIRTSGSAYHLRTSTRQLTSCQV